MDIQKRLLTINVQRNGAIYRLIEELDKQGYFDDIHRLLNNPPSLENGQTCGLTIINEYDLLIRTGIRLPEELRLISHYIENYINEPGNGHIYIDDHGLIYYNYGDTGIIVQSGQIESLITYNNQEHDVNSDDLEKLARLMDNFVGHNLLVREVDDYGTLEYIELPEIKEEEYNG